MRERKEKKTSRVYPLGELRVHHEVVDVFLRPSQLQFPRDDGHEQRRAASTLQHWINPQSTLFWLGGQTVVALSRARS